MIAGGKARPGKLLTCRLDFPIAAQQNAAFRAPHLVPCAHRRRSFDRLYDFFNVASDERSIALAQGGDAVQDSFSISGREVELVGETRDDFIHHLVGGAISIWQHKWVITD